VGQTDDRRRTDDRCGDQSRRLSHCKCASLISSVIVIVEIIMHAVSWKPSFGGAGITDFLCLLYCNVLCGSICLVLLVIQCIW